MFPRANSVARRGRSVCVGGLVGWGRGAFDEGGSRIEVDRIRRNVGWFLVGGRCQQSSSEEREEGIRKRKKKRVYMNAARL